jgi:hypothetical protein
MKKRAPFPLGINAPVGLKKLNYFRSTLRLIFDGLATVCNFLRSPVVFQQPLVILTGHLPVRADAISKGQQQFLY